MNAKSVLWPVLLLYFDQINATLWAETSLKTWTYLITLYFWTLIYIILVILSYAFFKHDNIIDILSSCFLSENHVFSCSEASERCLEIFCKNCACIYGIVSYWIRLKLRCLLFAGWTMRLPQHFCLKSKRRHFWQQICVFSVPVLMSCFASKNTIHTERLKQVFKKYEPRYTILICLSSSLSICLRCLFGCLRTVTSVFSQRPPNQPVTQICVYVFCCICKAINLH